MAAYHVDDFDEKSCGADSGVENLNERFVLGQGLVMIRIAGDVRELKSRSSPHHFTPCCRVSETILQFEFPLQNFVYTAYDVRNHRLRCVKNAALDFLLRVVLA